MNERKYRLYFCPAVNEKDICKASTESWYLTFICILKNTWILELWAKIWCTPLNNVNFTIWMVIFKKKTIEFKINFLYSQLYGEKYFPIVNYTHITVRAKEVWQKWNLCAHQQCSETVHCFLVIIHPRPFQFLISLSAIDQFCLLHTVSKLYMPLHIWFPLAHSFQDLYMLLYILIVQFFECWVVYKCIDLYWWTYGLFPFQTAMNKTSKKFM